MELGIYFAAGKSGSAAGARRQKAKGVGKTDGSPTFAAFGGTDRENHKSSTDTSRWVPCIRKETR